MELQKIQRFINSILSIVYAAWFPTELFTVRDEKLFHISQPREALWVLRRTSFNFYHNEFCRLFCTIKTFC